MDFLDPKRKKAHRRRLLYGYILMAIAVAMGTLILLFTAFGFDINRKTGDVIQNGTVFLDSQPGGSTVTLNGVVQGNKTSTRLVLPGGQQYSIKLSQDGYHDWQRTFSLEGGRIERITYPLLIPNKLITKETQLYASQPGLSTQSPDRKWLLVQKVGETYVFDMYDTTNPTSTPVTVTIPSTVLTEPNAAATLSVVEWSSDNRHLLINRNYQSAAGAAQEFMIIDTQSVASSINVNSTLTVSPSRVTLRDKKPDQVFLYDATGGIVRTADIKNKTVSAAILSNVLSYKTYGPDLVLYATAQGAADGRVNIRIREDTKATYLLKSITASTSYPLDIAEYNNIPYFVVGSPSEDAVLVYRDPLPTLKGQRQTPLLISSVLRVTNPRFVAFSAGTQFISAQSGNKVIVYDIDADRQYKLTLNHPITIDTKLHWMDGFRFVLTDKNVASMIDFDGSNEQLLVPSLVDSTFFSPDYKLMLTLAPSTTASGRFALTETSLIKK